MGSAGDHMEDACKSCEGYMYMPCFFFGGGLISRLHTIDILVGEQSSVQLSACNIAKQHALISLCMLSTAHKQCAIFPESS